MVDLIKIFFLLIGLYVAVMVAVCLTPFLIIAIPFCFFLWLNKQGLFNEVKSRRLAVQGVAKCPQCGNHWASVNPDKWPRTCYVCGCIFKNGRSIVKGTKLKEQEDWRKRLVNMVSKI